MSTTAPDAAGSAPAPPVLVADALDLIQSVREHLQDPAYATRAYTQSFSYKVTDLSIGVNVAVTVSRALNAGNIRALCGWAVKETTNAATAAFTLHDGSSSAGSMLVPINLAINESTRDIVFPHGIEVTTGRIFLNVISGSVSGVIYWR